MTNDFGTTTGDAMATTAMQPHTSLNMVIEIRAALASLRPAERKVAEMVLADVDRAIHASITDLARWAEVSEPSVTRFCRGVGCDGLRSFKVRLAQSVATGLSYTTTTVLASDSTSTLLDKVASASAAGVEQVRQLDPAATLAAIEALAAAPRVFFLGVGTGSSTVAQSACLQFLRLDKTAHAFDDAHQQRLFCHLLEPGDAVVAISHGGASAEILQSVEIAGERGATTIAITNRGSPLSRRADIALTIQLPGVIDAHNPGVSRLVHITILDVLSMGVALRTDRHVLEKVRVAKARLLEQTTLEHDAHIARAQLMPAPRKKPRP